LLLSWKKDKNAFGKKKSNYFVEFDFFYLLKYYLKIQRIKEEFKKKLN
jgi:hypothetical protein